MNTPNVPGRARFQQHLPILLGLMVLPLHGAVLVEPGGTFYRILLPNHFLLFLVWFMLDRGPGQPLLRPVLALLLLALATGFSPGRLGLLAWTGLLGSLLACRLGPTPWTLPYGGPCLYLLVMFFAVLLPEHIGSPSTQGALIPVTHGLAALALLTSLIPLPATRKTPSRATPVTLATTLMLLVATVAMLTIILSNGAYLSYPWSLFTAAGATAAGLLLGILLFFERPSPQDTDSGMESVRNRRQWQSRLQELMDQKPHPSDFIEQGFTLLGEEVGLTGSRWRVGNLEGAVGSASEFRHTCNHELTVELYFWRPPDTQLIATVDERVQLLELFLDKILLERKLQSRAHMEAIYETGARITHDVKNTLQSLRALNNAAQKSLPEQAGELQLLLQQQLPQLTRRIERALDKLQAPEQVSGTFQIARLWWEDLKSRYRGSRVRFSDQIATSALVPRDVFDRIAENLLENALRKQKEQPEVDIQIRLEIDNEMILLAVCDTGSRIPQQIEKNLFIGPVDSSRGYGIGLYQAAQHAQENGFSLLLENNEDGEVCFLLSGKIIENPGPLSDATG